MDDLLREIKKLSARIKEGKSDSSSSKEGTTGQQTSAKKIAKKRQKNRQKKHRGRKRRLKYIPDFEADSSSFTDCTDEDIIRDYIENITADLSDSDVDSTLRKGAFLMKRDLSSSHDFRMPISPEVDETDSFSESFRLTRSRKKRRRYKRHSMDGLDQQIRSVNQAQRDRIHEVLTKQYSKSSKTTLNKKLKLEEEGEEITMELDHSQDSSQANSSSENSDSSSPGSEADDEGEESCIESSSTIKPVIPWWNEQKEEVDMCITEGDISEVSIEQSLSLIRNRTDFKTRLMKSNGPLLCETGGYVAYANHKIKNFVLHRDSNELSLYTANKKEQNQVLQLAVLYNLQCSLEDVAKCSKAVLTKTMITAEPNQEALKIFLSREVKLRCRKNRPPPQWNHKRRKVTSVPENNGFPSELMDVPIPDSNVGSQMLRTMGWKPGQGLGKDSTGMTNPVKAVMRPRHLGFGHPGIT